MYLKEQFKILGKFIWLFLTIVILTTFFAFLFAEFVPTKYISSAAFSVNRIPEKSTDNYQFDGYYALQANALFAKQFSDWLKSPLISNAIIKRAGEKGLTKSASSKLDVVTSSPQSIEARFKRTNKNEAEILGKSALEIVGEKKDEFTGAAYSQDVVLGIVNSAAEPVVTPSRPPVLLSTAVGLALGLILGAIIVYLANIFRSVKEEKKSK